MKEKETFLFLDQQVSRSISLLECPRTVGHLEKNKRPSEFPLSSMHLSVPPSKDQKSRVKRALWQTWDWHGGIGWAALQQHKSGNKQQKVCPWLLTKALTVPPADLEKWLRKEHRDSWFWASIHTFSQIKVFWSCVSARHEKTSDTQPLKVQTVYLV